MNRHESKWTRDELIVAFNLYCKIPFGRIHNRNPDIIKLATALGRTPSAVSWKLANFARLDPSLGERKVAGATHGSNLEIEVWNEFNGNWEALAFESERLLAQITGGQLEQVAEIPEQESTWEGIERERLVRVRVNQNFFRLAVLAAYEYRCCITGLAVPELLSAGHIIPWSADPRNRMNPHNGLALNALHDRAFDRGLLTITPNLQVNVSPQLLRSSVDEPLQDFIVRYNGASVSPPSRFAPDPLFLSYHNKHVFRN